MELQRPPRAGFKRKGFVMKEVQSPKKPLIYYTGFGPVISLISGTLSVMTGVMLLVYPNAGRIVMTLLFPPVQFEHDSGVLRRVHVYFHAGFEHHRSGSRRADAHQSVVLVAFGSVYHQLLSDSAGH